MELTVESGRDERGRFVVGSKPGGGRPKGSSRAARRLGLEIFSFGETPLEFLLKKMRDETADPGHRVTAAVACLPYCHARRRRDMKPFVLPTPANAAEAAATLATLPARVAGEELDPDVANAIAASLRSYLEAFTVTGLEAKVKALIDARKGNGVDEGPIDIAPADLDERIIDLKPNPEDDNDRGHLQ
jgi:hypothetical protein